MPKSLGGPGTHLLKPGQSLKMNEFLLSKNRQYRLDYQSDGNLAIYDLTITYPQGTSPIHKQIWSANTQTHTPGKVEMQSDGNLGMWNSADQPVWSTNTANHRKRGVCAVLQDNGHLVVHVVSPGWDSSRPPQDKEPVPETTNTSSNGVNLSTAAEYALGSVDAIEVILSLL